MLPSVCPEFGVGKAWCGGDYAEGFQGLGFRCGQDMGWGRLRGKVHVWHCRWYVVESNGYLLACQPLEERQDIAVDGAKDVDVVPKL
jgi:hypothetical protein